MTTLPLSVYFASRSLALYLQNIVLYINYTLPGVFDHNVYPSAVNGSLWSLPAEFFLYLITPILLARIVNFGRFNYAVITISFVVAAVMLVRVYPRTSQFVVYATNVWSWLEVAPYFLIGAAFALYRLERVLNIYVAFVALLLIGLLETPPALKDALLLCVLPYATLSFGLGHAFIFQRITQGNDLSYGVYLFGFPIQQAIIALIGPQIGPWGNTAIASIICVILAYSSWNLVERPMLSWKPSRQRPVPEVAAASLAE